MAANGTTPVRPDEAPAQRVRERRWLPAIVLVALVLGLVLGGHAVAGPGSAPAAVAIDGVRVHPATGWDLVASSEGWARLHRGPAVLDIYAAPPAYTGPAGVAATYVEQVLRPSLVQVTIGEPAYTTIAGGVPAVRVGYVGVTDDGVAIEGVVVAASGASRAVVFDAAAPQGALATIAADVARMLDTTEVQA